jgi:hypothetical protein
MSARTMFKSDSGAVAASRTFFSPLAQAASATAKAVSSRVVFIVVCPS